MKGTAKKKREYKLKCESESKNEHTDLSVIEQLAKERTKPTVSELSPHTQASFVASDSLLSAVAPTSRIGYISRFISGDKGV